MDQVKNEGKFTSSYQPYLFKKVWLFTLCKKASFIRGRLLSTDLTFLCFSQSDSNNTPNRLGGVMGSSISLVADPSNPLSVAAAALASSRISPSSPPSSVALSGLQTAPPTLVPPPPSQLQLQTNRLQLQSPVASSAKIRVP